MLLLAKCSKLEVIPLNLLSSLKRLEILNMENSFNQWEAEGSSKSNDNASLIELKHLPNLSSLDICIPNAFALPKDLFLENSLKRYRIFIGENWEWSSKYETSKTLKLKLKSSIHLEFGVQKLLESVEDLCLDKLKGINNVLCDLDGRGFPNLKHLWIQNNDQIEYIITSTGFVNAFPNLETLNLHNLNGLKKLCQGQITATSFHKLRVIKVSGCNQLKVLFSMSMIELFRSLVEIDISGCESIKEIVVSSNENTFQQNLAIDVIFYQLRSLKMVRLPTLTNFFSDENATNNGDGQILKSFFSNKVSFPSLEILEISFMNIQYIWDDQHAHNSFSNLKTLVVEKCHFLVKLIPLHLLKCLSNLEELEVRGCDSLEMVFDFEELKSADKEIHSLLVIPLKKLHLMKLPKLKHVWSNDSKGIVSFQSLQHVIAHHCESLTNMFPASIAKSLLHLEELSIEDSGIEVIVAKDEVLESVTTFVFAKLTSLKLKDLPNTKNFYPHVHSLECPRLQTLHIVNCDELEILQEEISSSLRLQEEEAHHTKYPLFFQQKQIPNLEQLTLDRKHAMMIRNGQCPECHFHKVRVLRLRVLPDNAATFLYGLLKRFPNLEKLRVENSSIQEIFSCPEALGDDAGQIAPFRKLTFWSLKKLKHIWNEHSQTDLFLQNLESLNVEFCSDLISLGPSSVSLKNLTLLRVVGCAGLLYLFTSSTARSLGQLTSLDIHYCSQIEEIIKKQGEDVEKEIVFKKLEYLRLLGLQRLKSFCSQNYTFMFPLLNHVSISECPDLTIFSPGVIETPSLKGVQIDYNENCLETNLNKTIQLLCEKRA